MGEKCWLPCEDVSLLSRLVPNFREGWVHAEKKEGPREVEIEAVPRPCNRHAVAEGH